ncbi:IS110 family transposase [Alicyclobacillus sp. TC]|uniref:IS110 family transposase n=1 Tax=Alicyclobacillus sp. TC TaxID=2606450 RepID=UPI001EE46A8C|nr:IS110 family transposase [Alicyclobacillus sp. TC]
MKSRLVKVQNQRVERISTTTLVIGIDIAKERHAAQAIHFRGIVLSNKPIIFSNDRSGFEHLERTIRKLQTTHGMDDVIIGMESTGHYWFNLANWLVKQGIDVVLVNPLTTKRNKENRDNSPSKNDPKDALVIRCRQSWILRLLFPKRRSIPADPSRRHKQGALGGRTWTDRKPYPSLAGYSFP